MSDSVAVVEHAPVSVADLVIVLPQPRRVFARVEDTGAYGPALVTLLFLLVLVGYLEVQTGLIDRRVDQQTETALADLEKNQGDLVDRIQLREIMDDVRKGGEFNKLIARLGVIVFTPVSALVSFLLISSVLYTLVALTGRKPEYHTLMSICTYSAAVVLVGHAVRLAMVVYYRSTEVATSLGRLGGGTASSPSWLSGIDPFRIWFWVLVVIGLTVTRQLSRRMAIASCVIMSLMAIGVRTAILLSTKT